MLLLCCRAEGFIMSFWCRQMTTSDMHICSFTNTQSSSANMLSERDNKPTNCSAVYLAMLGFVHCKRATGPKQVCMTKGSRSQGGERSESCVLLIIGRRMLAFTLVDQVHGNRCDRGRWWW